MKRSVAQIRSVMAGNIQKPVSKGFTLLELMVVITIIGIILVIAIPNFASMQQRARIRAGAHEIAQDFRQIRERALGLSGNFTITRPDNYHYQVTNPNGQITTYKLGSTTGGRLQFGATSAVGTPPEANGAIPGNGFDFPGGLIIQARGAATKGVAYITDGKDDYAVGINPLGKVQVYEFTNGVWQKR
jgi:prepilin-type N-terminal cleavage/methylation domain-containing protein